MFRQSGTDSVTENSSKAITDGAHQAGKDTIADASAALSLAGNAKDASSKENNIKSLNLFGRYGDDGDAGTSRTYDNREMSGWTADKLSRLIDENGGNGGRIKVGDVKDGKVDFNVTLGPDSDKANQLVSDLDKYGYELKVMFGPNAKDGANKEVADYEKTAATANMSVDEALASIKGFFISKKPRHDEIVSETTKIFCHPAEACPAGPHPTVFIKPFLEISGTGVHHGQYAKLNGALKVLEENKVVPRVHFE